MNIEKLLKLREDVNKADFDDGDKIIQEFSDTINPEKYITKQTILKVIERNNQGKRTNVENIKDEDKIIAYMFIEKTLGLDINVKDKVLPLLKGSYYSGQELFEKVYYTLGNKYKPLIYSIYDEVNNFNKILSNFGNKYTCNIWTHSSYDDSKHLLVFEPDSVHPRCYMQFKYDNIDELVKDLPRLDNKLEKGFEFRNKMYKEIDKYNDLAKELAKDPLFIKKDSIHDVQYKFHVWERPRYDNLGVVEYQVTLCQKYHEKQVNIFKIDEFIDFKDNDYINKLDSINIEEIIDNIRLNDGKPYEYEVTIENLPTRQYLFDSTSAAIKRITDKDGNYKDGNFYKLTEQINGNIYLDITDSYTIEQDRNNCGQGRVGIVMSIFYFNKDFDIHEYLMKLKTLYYKNIVSHQSSLSIADEEDFYAAFDNASVKDLGQTRKELVKLIS